MCSIPVIDFPSCSNVNFASVEAREKISSELVKVLSETGFVYLRNHGIPSGEIEKVNEVTKLFFESPLELKNTYTENRSLFGYVGVQQERIDPSKYPGYKEMFNVTGCFLDTIDSSQWPDDLSSEFSVTIKSFMIRCKELALNILDLLGIGLKLKQPDYLRQCHSLIHKEGNNTALRTLYYPSLPDDLTKIETRLVEHSDYGSITLLFQDEVGGLQIQCANGSYIEATPIRDTVLVNIGDALEFWTRGKLKSTMHKVQIPSDMLKRKTVRRSIAYFVNPNNDVRLDQELIQQNQEEVCESKPENPITFFQYLDDKLTKSFPELHKDGYHWENV